MSGDKIFLYSIIAFIFGIALVSFLGVPLKWIISTISLGLLIILCISKIKFKFNKSRLYLPVFFFCLFLILGAWRWSLSQPKISPDHLNYYWNEKLIFQGEVVQNPEIKGDKTRLIIGKIIINDQKINGRALVFLSLYSDYSYGDVLSIQGKLGKPKPFDDFNYHEYLAKDEIYALVYFPKIKKLNQRGNWFFKRLYNFKNKAEKIIQQHLPEPQSSILTALLLGLKKQIPNQIREEFNFSGLAHILAVSGLHVAVLVQLLSIILINVFLIRRTWVFIPVAILVILFVLLAGCPASAIRAAIMGLGLLLALQLGRPQSGSRLVILAAGIMLLFNPRLLKADVGFQLSFSAVLGISLWLPYLSQVFQKLPNFRWWPLRDYLIITLSAQVFTLPLVLYYFGYFSLGAFLSNLMVLPVLPWVMLIGIVLIFTGMIVPFLAGLLSWIAWIGLTWIWLTANLINLIPGMNWQIKSFKLLGLIIFYLLIFSLYFLIRKIVKNKDNQKIKTNQV